MFHQPDVNGSMSPLAMCAIHFSLSKFSSCRNFKPLICLSFCMINKSRILFHVLSEEILTEHSFAVFKDMRQIIMGR